jgi:hypothetical protein
MCGLFYFSVYSREVYMDIDRPQFYTIAETAKILKLSRVSISNRISRKEIPVVRIGGNRSRALIPAAYIKNLETEALKAAVQ